MLNPREEIKQLMGGVQRKIELMRRVPVRRGNPYDLREIDRSVNQASWRAHELRR